MNSSSASSKTRLQRHKYAWWHCVFFYHTHNLISYLVVDVTNNWTVLRSISLVFHSDGAFGGTYFFLVQNCFCSKKLLCDSKIMKQGKKIVQNNELQEREEKNCWVHSVCSLDENRSNIEHKHDQIEKLNIIKWHVVEVLHSPAFVAVFTCILHFM